MSGRMLRRYMVFDGLSPTFKHIPAVKAEEASSAASCLLNIKEDRYGGVEVSHPRALLLAASCCCRCRCTALLLLLLLLVLSIISNPTGLALRCCRRGSLYNWVCGWTVLTWS